MEFINYIKKHERSFGIILFACMFIFGLFFINSLSSNFDENIEQTILKRNVKEYSELIGYKSLTNNLDRAGIVSISLDIEKDHGIAPYYLFTPVLSLSDDYPHITSLIWKLITYSYFFIGMIFLFLLIKYLFKNKKLAYLVSLLYFLSPRIFIDGMHNNKDMVLMSLIIVMIYFFFRLIKENKLRYVVLFSIAASLVCNIKIIGIFFTFVLGIIYFVYLYLDKRLDKKNIIYGFLTVLITFFLFIIITPAIWGTGEFLIIDYVKYCLDNSVNFRAMPSVLFEGQIYTNDVNPLPWYYVPKLICITLPVIIPCLFIFSLVLLTIHFFKRKIENRDIKYLMIAVFTMFIVPFLIAILKHPNIYNGWRHFYFLYAFIMIIACYGLNFLLNNLKTKRVIVFLIVLTLVTNIYCLLRNGVANTAYYNILVGNKDLSTRYELDYYNITTLEAIKSFMNSGKMEKNEDGFLYLYGEGFNTRVVSDMLQTSSDYYRDRILHVTKDNINEYSDKIIYDLSNYLFRTDEVNNYEFVYSYKVFNNSIINFYRMQ